MTLLRRIAVRISQKAVEKAKPGCREWAEGLAREVAFIQSDWRALAWALGCWRVLLRNPPKPLGTPEEIARAGRIYAGNREHVPPMAALIMATQVINFGLRASGHLSIAQRAGLAVAAVNAAYLAVVTWLETRMLPRPDDMDDIAWIAFYRSELVRVRDLYSGFGSLYRPAIVLWFAGLFLDAPQPSLTYCVFAVGAPIGGVALLNLVDRFQRRIDQVDSALKRCGGQA